MKKFLFSLIMILLLFSCYQKVPAGNVGVQVFLLGSAKGVDSKVLGVGQYWIGINQELYLYPVFIQQYTFTQGKDGDSKEDEAFYFQNKDGVKCNLDLSIQAHADPEKVSILFQKYRDDLRDVMHVNLRNYIRDRIQYYASGLSIEELYSEKKMKMIQNIEEDLKKEVSPYGIIIDGISLLSDIRFPKDVEDAIVLKIKATQEALQRENEVKKANAEAEIKVVQAQAEAKSKLVQATAEAESIRLKQLSITPLMVQYEATQKWDGKLPQYMMGNSLPFVNLK